MASWNEGYVTEIQYTPGYYTELNPLRRKLILLSAGIYPTKIETACELGFGQGVSVAVHAAASSVEWWGTDFNPGQTVRAQQMGKPAGENIHLSEDSFAEFCSREDLPDFDFIGLHGIWSWVSEANQKILVDFFRRKLKPGGIVYMGYNVPPGWTTMLPWRDFMNQYLQSQTAPGKGIAERIDETIAFMDRLIETNPAFTAVHPQIIDRMKSLKAHDRHYLAHEYFNRDWNPMHFSDLAGMFAEAKLEYAGPATYSDLFDQLNISEDHRNILASIPDVGLKETTRDFILNRQFRKDYWIKGKRSLSVRERDQLLREMSVVLIKPRDQVSTAIQGTYCTGTLNETIVATLLDCLGDHQPKLIAELEKAAVVKGISLELLLLPLQALVGRGELAIAQEDPTAQESADRFNDFVISEARRGEGLGMLVSAIIGGGVHLSQFEILFVDSCRSGKSSVDELAESVWRNLASRNEVVMREGVGLSGEDENLAELIIHAETFMQTQFPILRGLKIL